MPLVDIEWVGCGGGHSDASGRHLAPNREGDKWHCHYSLILATKLEK